MGPLLTFLAKQTGLQTLSMNRNKLSASQKEEILQTVSENALNCTIEYLV